jgi:hypothetical protein
MEHLPILGPSGEATFRFGGKRAWKQFTYKDYIVSLEWFGPDGRHVDACMVIWNARPNTNDAGALIVGRRQITKYCDEHMKPTPYAFGEVAQALPVLGRAPLNFEVHALIDTILHHIDDLIHMPIAPLAVRRELSGDAMFEVTHKEKDSGKVLHEAAI